MFGYLNIEKDKLEEGKRGLWQTFMCGLCFSTKKLFGNAPRMLISNDVNFFNVLFHSVIQADVTVEQHRCFSSPFVKRAILKPTELTDTLAVANVLLTYWNLYDDVTDGGGLSKKTALQALKRAYKKARSFAPELDDMLSERYSELRQMEQAKNGAIDAVAHSFSLLSMQFAQIVLGDEANEHVQNMCYNLGKWIYLVDALDDADKDTKRGNYNPFVACYGEKLYGSYEELKFVMFAVLNRVAMAYNDLNLTKYKCVLDNVVYDSIRDKTNSILERYRNAPAKS